MHETEAEIAALQQLMDTSVAGGNEHLRDIMTPGRLLSAASLVHVLDGMQVLVVATVTAGGRPLTSCVDGHLLRVRWVFTTSATATKARHLAVRPAVSATHARGDTLGVFTHGTAERLTPSHPDFADVDGHLTAFYGVSPTTFGPDIAFLRVQPTWMLAYAADPAALVAGE